MQDLTGFKSKYNDSYLNQVSFVVMSIIMQTEYSHKQLRPLLEFQDPMREGKVQYEVLKNVLLGNNIDLWLSDIEIECLMEFLDPCI